MPKYANRLDFEKAKNYCDLCKIMLDYDGLEIRRNMAKEKFARI